jgi:hypothetical protein
LQGFSLLLFDVGVYSVASTIIYNDKDAVFGVNYVNGARSAVYCNCEAASQRELG